MLVKAISILSILFIMVGLNQESVYAITNNDIAICNDGTPAPNGVKEFCNYIADSSGHLAFLKCPINTNSIGGNCISTFQEPILIPEYSATKSLSSGGGGSHVIISNPSPSITNIAISEKLGLIDINTKQTTGQNNPTILFGCYPYSIFKCSNSTQPIKPQELFQCYPLSLFKC